MRSGSLEVVEQMKIEHWNLYSKTRKANYEQVACGEHAITIDEAVRRLNELTDALAFYADPSTYVDKIADDYSECGDSGSFPGSIARQVLGVDEPVTEGQKN